MVKDSDWHAEKRARCIEKYSSKTKMKSVIDWKKRMAVTGVTAKAIAQAVGMHPPRISEYVSCLTEPSDDIFEKVEALLRTAEKAK